MQNKKVKLNLIQPGNTIAAGTTCFSAHSTHGVDCQRKRCPHWISYKEGHNCVMIAADEGSHTLQEIGEIYGLTRMRICQIEKNIYETVRRSIVLPV